MAFHVNTHKAYANDFYAISSANLSLRLPPFSTQITPVRNDCKGCNHCSSHRQGKKKKRILLINFLRKMKEINLFLLFLRYPDSMFQSSIPLFCSNGIRVAKVNPLKIW